MYFKHAAEDDLVKLKRSDRLLNSNK